MGIVLSPVGLGNKDPWACGENKTNSGETDPEGQEALEWGTIHLRTSLLLIPRQYLEVRRRRTLESNL